MKFAFQPSRGGACVLVSIFLVAALLVDWNLSPSYPVAAIYAVPVLIAAIFLSPREIAATAAAAVLASTLCNILQGAVDTPLIIDNVGLLLIGYFTVQLAVERRSTARREREAQAAEAHYRSLFEGVADSVIVGSTDGTILDVNAALVELTGYSREEIRTPLMSLAADPSRAGDPFAEQAGSGRWHREFEIRRKDGRTVSVESRGTTVESPTGAFCLVSLRDVSERRALEKLRRDFSAMVTHELRNPLAPIRAYAEFLKLRGTYDELAVQTIVGKTQQLDRLIGDLLDMSQVESGRLELRRTRLDLVRLARACAEHAQATSTIHRVSVQVPDRPLEGSWDAGRLEQIFENLLSNAIKYSADGGEIVVRVQDLGSGARVSVQDCGIGIPSEAIALIFAPFYRHEGARRKARGLGLGLYITKSLVEAHGGHIEVESASGRGAALTFWLPYEPPSANAVEAGRTSAETVSRS